MDSSVPRADEGALPGVPLLYLASLCSTLAEEPPVPRPRSAFAKVEGARHADALAPVDGTTLYQRTLSKVAFALPCAPLACSNQCNVSARGTA